MFKISKTDLLTELNNNIGGLYDLSEMVGLDVTSEIAFLATMIRDKIQEIEIVKVRLD